MTALAETLAHAERQNDAGQAAVARETIARALETPHERPDDLLQIAQTCVMLDETVMAEKAFRLATTEFPGDAASHHNLGSFYASNKRYAEAEIAYCRALAIAPNDADTIRNLAHVNANQGHLEEAERQFRRAHELEPNDLTARPGWAQVLQSLGRIEAVPDVISPVLAKNPRDLRARITLSGALNTLGRYGEQRRLLHDFLAVAQPIGNDTVKLVLDMFSNPEIDAAEEGRLLSGIFDYLNDDLGIRPAVAGKTPHEKLTVGYLTKHLDKPNYLGFLSAVLDRHDPNSFDVTVYSDTPHKVPGDDVAHVGNLSDMELNRRIRADGIDILVDLNGFSSVDRMGVLAMKPAPVIVSWFNAFSSLGLEAVDYLLGDAIVTPAEEDAHYVERIWRLPECYLLWNATAPHPPVTAPPLSRNGYATFGSLATSYKIGLKTIELWASILGRVPESRFLIRNTNIDKYQERFYRNAFAAHGIEPDRIVTLSGAGHYRFLETYDEIDISLDSFPWNGGTTTFEALWQGVPVVTCSGNRWASRVAATTLAAIGRPEWVGTTPEDYADIAVALAQDPDALARMRHQQRRRMEASVLCDAARFAGNLEAAYREMYRNAAATEAAA